MHVSTHSRPKAAGSDVPNFIGSVAVSTHSRPKAAGMTGTLKRLKAMFQHTAARRRLGILITKQASGSAFQHTAARRRLDRLNFSGEPNGYSFNTQPPEGGWAGLLSHHPFAFAFQHTAARRRLVAILKAVLAKAEFQHTAARRRLVLYLYTGVPGAGSFNTQPPEGGWNP